MTTERSNEPVGFDAFLGDNSASAASVPEPEHDEAQAAEPTTTYTGKRVRQDATVDEGHEPPPAARDNRSVLKPMTPTMGWPKYRYALNRLLKKPHIVPALSRKQSELISADYDLARQMMQDEINAAHDEALIEHTAWKAQKELEAKTDYRDALDARVKYLGRDMGISATIAIANIKSATKTATTLGSASEMAELTRKKTVLLPMTSNTATATAGKMAGIVGSVVTIDEYIEQIESFADAFSLDRVPGTDAGLTVVVEGNSGAANDDDEDKVVKLVHAVDVSLNSVRFLYLDLGNDNIRRRRIALQAARLAHVLVFPFNVQDPITHDSLRETLDGYNSDKGIPEDIWKDLYEDFRNIDRTGINTPTPVKVAQSIVVATKAEGPVDFNYYTRPMRQDASAEGFMEWDGTGICVPLEPRWTQRNPNGGVTPYSREKIQLETHISYLEITVAALELAGHAQGINIGTPMVANIPQLSATAYGSRTEGEAR